MKYVKNTYIRIIIINYVFINVLLIIIVIHTNFTYWIRIVGDSTILIQYVKFVCITIIINNTLINT
jgi:hypothetical protein